MNNSIKGLLEEWKYIRGITKCCVENLKDSDLDKELPRKNLNTIRKQCEEMLIVQKCYIEALDTGFIKFDGYKDQEFLGKTTREELLKKCNHLDSLLLTKLEEFNGDETIEWFGEEKIIYAHLAAMVSHESLHVGQIVAFCYAENIQIPQEVVNGMALSN